MKATPIADRGTITGSKYSEQTPYKGQLPPNTTDDHKQVTDGARSRRMHQHQSTPLTNGMQQHRQQKSPGEQLPLSLKAAPFHQTTMANDDQQQQRQPKSP